MRKFVIDNRKGFTLIELLLVVGLMMVMLMGALPIYSGFQVSTQLDESCDQVVQDMRLTRELSHAGVHGLAHGVKFLGNQYVMFEGASYATRNAQYDRVNAFSTTINMTTTLTNDEIVFAAGTGVPDRNGNVLIRHSTNGTRTVTINELGGSVIDQ
jgi:Tfp pilus assembly protein FimT